MKKNYLLIALFSVLVVSCSKDLDTKPTNLIIASAQFATDSKANDAVVGIYSVLNGDNVSSILYTSTVPSLLAISADEFTITSNLTAASREEPFYLANNIAVTSQYAASLWSGSYNVIYQANSVIDNVAASTGMSAAGKIRSTAEADFLRAFMYFYLINIYGDVPLVTTSNYLVSNNLPRTPVKTVYQQIITDLTYAAANLSDTYFTAGKVRVNQATAKAMLAKVYLYTGDYANAQINASAVIADSQYSINIPYAAIFLNNSKEAIWQLYSPFNYVTFGSTNSLPASTSNLPSYVVTDTLLKHFEVGDLRKAAFTTSGIYVGAIRYVQNKYKNTSLQTANVAPESYMVLRLAEQYLIRAEAFAQQNNITAAVADVNVIRARAGLPALPATITQANLLLAIEQERRIELCFEWGDRWLNTKRTGRANAVFGADKTGWKPTAALFPIPNAELINNQTLTQNPGY